MPLVVLLDACVLYPYALVDFWCTADEVGLIRACWSTEILDEVRRNLVPRVPSAQVDRRLDAMRRAFPSAVHDPPGDLVDRMTCHPKDRHVLAAGVAAGVDYLVTFNLRDFPATSTAPHGITVVNPDELALLLIDADPSGVQEAVDEMAALRRRPPNKPADIIDTLAARGMPSAMAALRQHPQKDT